MQLYAGFVGQNVTLPCTSFQPDHNDRITDVNWHFKCPSCGVEWSPLFHSKKLSPEQSIDFMGETASVSRSTGSLMVVNFQAALEGLYKCQSRGNKTYVMELKSAGELNGRPS